LSVTRTRRDRFRLHLALGGGAALAALGLLIAVFVGGALHPTRFALSHPDSFLDFAPAVLTSAGAIGVIAAAAGRRVQLRRAATWGAVVVALLLIASGVTTVVRRTTVTASDGKRALLLRAQHTTFAPRTIDARGRTFRIVVRNGDPYAHTFTVDGLGIDEYVGPGSDRLVWLARPKAGSYSFMCRVTGHDAMRGTLVVG
jgi:uncharacterized cupredoxin-like copper-binding protein